MVVVEEVEVKVGDVEEEVKVGVVVDVDVDVVMMAEGEDVGHQWLVGEEVEEDPRLTVVMEGVVLILVSCCFEILFCFRSMQHKRGKK